MIEYFYEVEMEKLDNKKYTEWLDTVLQSEGFSTGAISFIFSTDQKVLELNTTFLDHDYFTDILSFDYSEGKHISGDVFISWDRVRANAEEYQVPVEVELRRVMAHGLLHFMGYKDNTGVLRTEMRQKEDEKLKMFHVEQ